MNKLLLILITSMLLFVALMTYWMDHWLGIVAFRIQFLLFSVLCALCFAAAWHSILQKHALVAGLFAFALFAVNFVIPAPSERILRTAQLKLQPGMKATEIESTIANAYQNTPYAIPRILWKDSSVLVSLSSQQAGNCTAIQLNLKDGRIAKSTYVAD